MLFGKQDQLLFSDCLSMHLRESSDALLKIIDAELSSDEPCPITPKLDQLTLILSSQRHLADMNIEILIRRVVNALGVGLPTTAIAEVFHTEGVSPETAFLAIQAGKILANDSL